MKILPPCPVPVPIDPGLGPSASLACPSAGGQASSSCGDPVSVAAGQGLSRTYRWTVA